MPRDSSGNYTKPNPDVVSGFTIASSEYNSTNNDVAAEMSDSLSRSGKGGMTAALNAQDINASGDIAGNNIAASGAITGNEVKLSLGGGNFARIIAVTGVPAAGVGSDNDYAFRTDPAVGAAIYIKLAGTWQPIA